MHRILRQLVSIAAGGIVVAAAFVGVRAWAQEGSSAAASVQPAQTTIVQGTAFEQVTYQGVLLDPSGNVKPNNTYVMTFRIYNDPTGGSIKWQETQNVVVVNGYFSVRLGSVTPLSPAVFMASNEPETEQVWLGVQVSPDAEMQPRQQLTRVPYAYTADRLTQYRAYGVVDANGTTLRGQGFSVSGLGNIGGVNNTFEINIGENYSFDRFVTQVTPILRGDCPNPVMAMTGSLNNRLLINFFRPDGSPVRCSFNFSVLALP